MRKINNYLLCVVTSRPINVYPVLNFKFSNTRVIEKTFLNKNISYSIVFKNNLIIVVSQIRLNLI